jgi:hypothetical protein
VTFLGGPGPVTTGDVEWNFPILVACCSTHPALERPMTRPAARGRPLSRRGFLAGRRP